MPIATINPATGETVKTFTPATDQEVDAAIARAYERFLDYRHNTTFAQRAGWANATADLLEAEADDVAAMMTLEMGKTLKSAKAEVLKCAKGFRYYAEHAEQLLADEPADAKAVGAKKAYIRYQPLGVVLAVMPWNFPLWQAVRFAALLRVVDRAADQRDALVVERGAQRREQFVGMSDPISLGAEAFRVRHHVRVVEFHVVVRPEFEIHLPFDEAVPAVLPDQHDQRYPLAHGGLDLLRVHQERAVADDGQHLGLRLRQLDAERPGKGEAHGGQAV